MDAIVCLTRGYKDNDGYKSLIARNASIYEHINSKLSEQYPLIIWHEGDITEDSKKCILSQENNSNVSFIDVSVSFLKPEDEKIELIDSDRWNLGYRRMCRFNAQQIWEWCFRFDYIMRLDEDCILMQVDHDPIQWTKDNEADFATAQYVKEGHSSTNKTLSTFVESYAKEHGHPGKPYSQYFPNTNFYVANVNFWTQLHIQNFLLSVTETPELIRSRWGDLPILGVALNLFLFQHPIVPGIKYWHGTHNTEVSSC